MLNSIILIGRLQLKITSVWKEMQKMFFQLNKHVFWKCDIYLWRERTSLKIFSLYQNQTYSTPSSNHHRSFVAVISITQWRCSWKAERLYPVGEFNWSIQSKQCDIMLMVSWIWLIEFMYNTLGHRNLNYFAGAQIILTIRIRC